MVAFTLGNFLYEQWSTVPLVKSSDIEGKTVVVIGANGGLGFEASKHLAEMKPGKLILGCRDSQKSKDALKAIKESTGNESVELWTIDLASFASVKAFADRFVKEELRLDILLENASVINPNFVETEDGLEASLQVNCIAPALLAILLLPIMISTGKKFQTIPRISIVASEVHMMSALPNSERELLQSGHFLKTLASKEYCTEEKLANRYYDTKLLEIYFGRSMTDHLGHQPFAPLVNTLNPGFCHSELARSVSGLVRLRMKLMHFFLARKTEVGSRTLVHATTGGVGNEDQLRGAYLSCCQIMEAGNNVVTLEGKKARNAVWAELIPILEQIDPRVKTIVAEHLSFEA